MRKPIREACDREARKGEGKTLAKAFPQGLACFLIASFLVVSAGIETRAGAGDAVPWMVEREAGAGPDRQTTSRGPVGIQVRAAWDRHPELWRRGDRWRMPIPEGGSGYEIVHVGEVRSDAAGGVLVQARLEGDPGSSGWMAFREGRMAAVIRRDNGSLLLLSPEQGPSHRIMTGEGGADRRCANGAGFHAETEDKGVVGQERGFPSGKSLAAVSGNVPHDVDLLICYTPAARLAAGGDAGIQVLLDLAVAEANDALARSAVNLRLRCVGGLPVDYVESGDLATDLTRLSRPQDGWLDVVDGLRDAHAADVVCLVTESENSNQFAGMANQLRTLEPAALSRGFAVCLRPYLLGNHTLAHEIGHALGANHDRETSPQGGMLPAAFGARFTVDGRIHRTVMAYRPGIQVPHFSNPDVSYHGVATGIRGVADNVETLNRVAPWIAAVREPASRVAFAESSVGVQEADGRIWIGLKREGSTEAADVRVRSVGGSARAGTDFEGIDTRVAFPAGVMSAQVAVNLLDTPDADGVRRFALVLGEPSKGLSVGPLSAVNVHIRDDEFDEGRLLDTSFRARPGADYWVRTLAVSAGDAVFVGGGFVTYGGEASPRLARVGRDGRRDSGFEANVKYQVNALAALSDGGVVLGGEFNTVNDERLNHVAILLPDGRLDPEFEFEVGTDLAVHALAVASDGKLVIAGRFTSVQGVPAQRVARVTRTGGVDPDFDTRVAADGDVDALLVDGDGRTVIAGRFRRVAGAVRGGVARLDGGGQLDPSFAAGSGADGPVWAVARDSQGRILVAGDFLNFDGRRAGRLVRLTETGIPDAAFRAGAGVGGGANGAIHAVLVRGDGKIWVGGRFVGFDGHVRHRVARLRDDGSLDPTFDPGSGPDDWVLALAEREDGGLVVAGVFTQVMGVPRGGVAVLLPGELGAVGMGWSGRGGDGWLGWTGTGWPRQIYALERSEDLSEWSPGTHVSADDGRLSGTISSGAGTSGFFRLRRVIE